MKADVEKKPGVGMYRGVAAIWGTMLAATGLVVVPVAVALLQRTLTAARDIERYTADMLASGIGVADNTAHVAALQDTLAVAPLLVSGVEALARDTASIEAALVGTAQANGQVAREGRRP